MLCAIYRAESCRLSLAARGRWRSGANWKKGLLEMIPFVLIVLSLFLYQKYFIHFFGRSLTPVTQFSPAHLADVLAGGFNVSLGPMGISFLYDRVRDGMQCFSLLWAKILLALTLVCLRVDWLFMPLNKHHQMMCRSPKLTINF